MILAIIGIIAGLAGHRTEPIFDYMEENGTPRTWWMSSRYGTGYLLAVLVFFISVFRKSWRDEATAAVLLSGVFVGVGTIAGKMMDELMDGRG
jgi:uncharacterized membrane protein YkvI